MATNFKSNEFVKVEIRWRTDNAPACILHGRFTRYDPHSELVLIDLTCCYVASENKHIRLYGRGWYHHGQVEKLEAKSCPTMNSRS